MTPVAKLHYYMTRLAATGATAACSDGRRKRHRAGGAAGTGTSSVRAMSLSRGSAALLLTAATPLGSWNSPQRRCHASHAASRTSVSCLRPLFLATVPCARPRLTIVRCRCCSGSDLRDLRVLRSGGLPAPGRWRVAGPCAGMTKTPSSVLTRLRVAAGGLQERARRRGGGGQPRAAAARARLLR